MPRSVQSVNGATLALQDIPNVIFSKKLKVTDFIFECWSRKLLPIQF